MDINELVALAFRVHDAEGMDFGVASSREQRNAHCARIVGMAHHGHPTYNVVPDPQWHIKNAGNGRAQSDDVAVSMPSRTFWDFITNAGIQGYRFETHGHGEFLPMDQQVYAPPVPSGSGGGVTPPPLLPSVWMAVHQAVLARLVGGDVSRDTLTVAQQLAHTFPGEGWGMKSTRPGSTASPDVIGRLVDGVLYGVRVVPFTSAPQTMTLGGQSFVAVNAMNHLDGDVVAPPPPPPPPQGCNLELFMAEMEALAASVETLRAEVIAAVKGQSYDIDASAGRLGRVKGTITPRQQQPEGA